MTGKSGGAAHQTLDPGPWHLGRVCVGAKPVDDYLRAVGDALPIYRQTGLAPPLYAAAAALGLLLKTLQLPPGAIHSLQEINTLSPITIGGELQAIANLERPRQRGGLQFITASCALTAVADDPSAVPAPALTGKTTVMAPPESGLSESRSKDAPDNPAPRKNPDSTPSDLPVISRKITPERLQAYAAAAGDYNPLHLDPDFAAATRFGGIIAHGMLTLAFLSEMLTAALGQRWLTAGSLRARFKGAAYIGDTVETWGRAVPPNETGNENGNGNEENFAAGVRNRATGEDLITAAATIKTP